MDRVSSVGIAARYGLDGPGIEFRWGVESFRTCPDRPRVHPASNTIGTGSFPGVNLPGRGVDHSPHLAPRLKKEWSFTSNPSGYTWPVIVRNFYFSFTVFFYLIIYFLFIYLFIQYLFLSFIQYYSAHVSMPVYHQVVYC